MGKGLNQTLAWVLAIFISGGIFAGVVMLLLKSKHDPFAARSHVTAEGDHHGEEAGSGDDHGGGHVVKADAEGHHNEEPAAHKPDAHGKGAAAHGKEPAHGKEAAAHGKEAAAHGKEPAHGKEAAAHGKEAAAHGKEAAAHGKADHEESGDHPEEEPVDDEHHGDQAPH